MLFGDEGPLCPEWVRSKEVLQRSGLLSKADEVGSALMATLETSYARVRKRRAWYIRFTQSCIFHSLAHWFGLPRDICNIIARHVILLPDPAIAALEEWCSDCHEYWRLIPAVGVGSISCTQCGKIMCWKDSECVVPGHSTTHRHRSRMRFEFRFEESDVESEPSQDAK